MKLLRHRQDGRIIPGILLDDNQVLDASAFGYDWNEDFFGSDGLVQLSRWIDVHRNTAPTLPFEGLDLDSAVARPSKIVCIGLNFSDHAEESGLEVPENPVIFFKSTTALCGPNDDLIIPKGAEKTDWEVELGVVIGKRASHVSEENALNYVAGYVLHNDYSERAFQIERGGQWAKGKSCDTFAPLGPYLATQDEIVNINNLRMWLTVNGENKQDGNTANLIFKIPEIVSHLSHFMTLLPGDVISTGTPAGVGLGFDPPQFLRPGDIVELGIDGLGSSRQAAVPQGLG